MTGEQGPPGPMGPPGNRLNGTNTHLITPEMNNTKQSMLGSADNPARSYVVILLLISLGSIGYRQLMLTIKSIRVYCDMERACYI